MSPELAVPLTPSTTTLNREGAKRPTRDELLDLAKVEISKVTSRNPLHQRLMGVISHLQTARDHESCVGNCGEKLSTAQLRNFRFRCDDCMKEQSRKKK